MKRLIALLLVLPLIKGCALAAVGAGAATLVGIVASDVISVEDRVTETNELAGGRLPKSGKVAVYPILRYPDVGAALAQRLTDAGYPVVTPAKVGGNFDMSMATGMGGGLTEQDRTQRAIDVLAKQGATYALFLEMEHASMNSMSIMSTSLTRGTATVPLPSILTVYGKGGKIVYRSTMTIYNNTAKGNLSDREVSGALADTLLAELL